MPRRTILASVHPGDDFGYVASCADIAVVTQGSTLEELVANLREAVELHFEGEDLAELGFAPDPILLVVAELPLAVP
jgi:predicted RNase H-like HicB family nuclease